MINRWLLLAMLGCALAAPAVHAQQGGIARIAPLPASGQAATQTAGIFHERDFKADPAVPSAVGNGNWHVWTVDGHRFVLRRYHTLRTEQDSRTAWLDT